jgi:hypothetical protein
MKEKAPPIGASKTGQSHFQNNTFSKSFKHGIFKVMQNNDIFTHTVVLKKG